MFGLVHVVPPNVTIVPYQLQEDVYCSSEPDRGVSDLLAILDKKKIKEQYLDYLHSHHLSGLVNFIRNFILVQ